MDKKYFEESEWPHDLLQQFGLSREMIEDLPSPVLDDLTEGRRSPMLPILMTNEEGQQIKTHARFSFFRNDNDSINVLFYPELIEADLSRFDGQQQEDLKNGKTIQGDIENKDGNMVRSYIQLDPDTKQVLSAPMAIIQSNMSGLFAKQQFTDTEENALQNGDTVTFLVDEDPVTIGIDLTDKCGLRILEGDEQDWKRRTKQNFEKYNYGVYGCWTMDDDGNLDYTYEEDYSEEMWEEQKKAGQKAMGMHR